MKDIKSTQSVNESSEVPTNTRRQFFKKAAIGSALLTTVSSRPVWAVGCTVSGNMSGNLSNPDRDDCTGKATGKSPGWWGKFKKPYKYFSDNPSLLFADVTDDDKQKYFGNGLGSKKAALYNFAYAAMKANDIAASNNLSGWVDLTPIDTNGNITPVGLAINNNGDQEYRHLIAGLLSAAHDGIAYPYPGNEWTVPYIWSKWKGTAAERQELDDLQRQFIGDHYEPSGILSAGTSKEERFGWAKDYLNN
ncbi:MAG: hypothetical protein ACJAXJ_000054 [Colwellia sp.]|jgi:hypothetical protein